MRKAHEKLVTEQGLNDEHFDAVAENLLTTLTELNILKDFADEIMTIASSARNDVLNR